MRTSPESEDLEDGPDPTPPAPVDDRTAARDDSGEDETPERKGRFRRRRPSKDLELDVAVSDVAEKGASPRRFRRWPILLVVGLLLLATLATVLVISLTGSDDPRQITFEPANPPVALSSQVDSDWDIIGDWTVDADGLVAVEPVERARSFATVDAGSPDEDIQVTFEATGGGAGLVFRYEDRRNFWSVWASVPYAAWVMYKRVDGDSQRVGSAPLSLVSGATTVEVRLDGPNVRFVADGTPLFEALDQTGGMEGAQRAGFYATRDDRAGTALWSQLSIGELGD